MIILLRNKSSSIFKRVSIKLFEQSDHGSS